jgi:hypothetical protein
MLHLVVTDLQPYGWGEASKRLIIPVPDDTSVFNITEFYVTGERKVLVEKLSLASRR